MGTNMSETKLLKEQHSSSTSEMNAEEPTLSPAPASLLTLVQNIGENDTKAQSEKSDALNVKNDSDISTIVSVTKTSELLCTFDPNSEDNVENNKFESEFKSDIDIKYHSTDSLDVVSVDRDVVCDFEDNKTDVASADSEDSALGSLPAEPVTITESEYEPQDRSDGSDSGLGSEIAEEQASQQPFNDLKGEGKRDSDSLQTDSANFELNNSNLECTNIGRQSEDACKAESSQTHQEINPVLIKSNLKRKISDVIAPVAKKKRGITFNDVTVFYFPRAQGFTCIPSQGGSTLGMAKRHTHVQKFTLAEHTTEQRRLHRQIIQQLRCERHSLQGSSVSSSDYSDSEDEPSEISESELDLDSYYFLQPVPTRQRRALLRAAGVRKIEALEKDECRDIRTSREFCGCGCKGYCDPETCSCSQAGIKCQVDRLNFPCGCTRDGCGNTTGRIEFNPVRVRTHFIHTVMRLGLEKKSEENNPKNEITDQNQWADTSNRLSMVGSSFSQNDSINCGNSSNKYTGNSVTSHVEAESCINPVTFSNMHYDNTTTVTKSGSNLQCREDSLDLYAFREDGYNEEQCGDINNSRLSAAGNSQQNQHIDTYSSNITKGKLIPYTETIGHSNASANSSVLSRFGCDINFSYPSHPETNHYLSQQQYSATNFEDFAQPSLSNVFNHYNPMYMNDYSAKTALQENEDSTSNPEYHNSAISNYGVYRTSDSTCYENSGEVKEMNQYTNLNSAAYPMSNKLESFSELIQGRYSYPGFESGENMQPIAPSAEHVDSQDPAAATSADPTATPVHAEDRSQTNDADENFGEIIKKTMVETVST